MNAKNQLQEFCQKRKLSIPIYNTIAVSHPITGWRSSITFSDIEYTSDVFPSKVKAELHVAELVLNDTITNLPTYRHPEQPDAYVFIDLENVPIPIDVNIRFKSTAYVVGILSSNSALTAFESELKSKMELIISPCTMHDGADVEIIMHITSLIIDDKIPKDKWIYIVSKDKLLETFANILIQRGFKVEWRAELIYTS